MVRAGQLVGGKYRLIHPLGMGGMGMVWKAEHDHLKQPVALKLMRGQQPRSAIKRFQREAQIAASIRHRNIVYISDFGIAEDGPYLVMELLQGVPLNERLYVGEPLGVQTFLSLIDETLQGLAAVHAAGIVHRDMKPANVFLVRDPDGSLHPKLLDFGVSRSTERDQGHTITVEGMVMGTPEYISPEQARGKVGDHRSDLYSLGVLVYEALGGCLPFHADNTADLMVALLNQTPTPLAQLRPELGARLSEVVMRSIQRDPDHRYQSTLELRAALASCNDDSLAKLVLPARVPPAQPSPHLSSVPPADPLPRLEQLSPTHTTEAVSAPRRGWLMLTVAGVLAALLAFTLARRTQRVDEPARAPERPRAVEPLVLDAGTLEQPSPGPVPEEGAKGADKPTGPTRRRAPEARPRSGKLLRNPGF